MQQSATYSSSTLTMDVSEPTPRVNFELMQRHMHKKVLLVGQIEGIESNVARVRAADGGTVQVMIKPGGVFDSAFVQFEGIVESPTQLAEVDHTAFGSDLGNAVFLAKHCWKSCLVSIGNQCPCCADLGVYNELCKISNQDFPSLFY